jgi:hypothetical protein
MREPALQLLDIASPGGVGERLERFLQIGQFFAIEGAVNLDTHRRRGASDESGRRAVVILRGRRDRRVAVRRRDRHRIAVSCRQREVQASAARNGHSSGAFRPTRRRQFGRCNWTKLLDRHESTVLPKEIGRASKNLNRDRRHTQGGEIRKPITQIAVSNTAGNHTASAIL